MNKQSKEMAKLAYQALSEKKAEDIRIIDISEISVIADYFIIASGSNANQLQAMQDSVDEQLYKAGYHAKQIEGNQRSSWILMDYSDIIIHIFSKEDRLFYDLERIWRDGKDGAEPNNWESIFKGSAWQYDENTEQYFLHLFSKRQPDLNWDNEEVRQEIYKMINWWLDKGIDGFRVDAISHIKKEPGLIDMDNPHNLNYVSSFDKHMNVDGIHEYLEELNKNTFSKYDIISP